MRTRHILATAAVAIAFAVTPATMSGQPATTLPRAVANDNRATAGQVIDGELLVELDVVEAEWYPRGDDGPRIVTPAFAAAGGVPSVPGPLIRATSGTPVGVTVHNRLAHAIEVRGLVQRAADAENVPPGFPPSTPAFLLAEPLVVPAGERRTARFTPDADVSSFYFGRIVPADAPPTVPTFVPGGIADEGAFVGALVIDDAAAPPHPDERVFVITRWGSPDEPGSLALSWKMMMNGRSWPHTERVELTVGDTAHWRIINTSMVSHPMHLHGFYFAVDALGNTQVDTVFSPDARRDVVTEMMQDMSSLRLRWVPERPGNWLFHCHLIRHSGELQRFEVDRQRAVREPATTHTEHSDAAQLDAAQMMDMDGMAGMILGITVHAADGEPDDPPPARRVELWTGARPGVYDGEPELGFVLQQGTQPPPPDSTVVPGSTLVLTRGEATEIVVHNRLDIPLSVHWHGLELRSLYDGVGHWSGSPGSVRPPIEPGGSQRVVIEPVRAGTFFYHTHGEPGHELAQGLYGAFIVLEPGETLNAEADRLFMLGSRGARIDASPAINGQTAPAPQRFDVERTYRLRFAHISPDELKRILLLRDGGPVQWRARAKDGADLPANRGTMQPATFGIGVGEAYDFEWTPDQPGVYVLEVRTSFYPSIGGSRVQRVAFGVGDVDDEALRRATQGELATVELTDAQRRRHVGTFTGRLLPADDPREFILAVWEQADRLYSSIAPRGEAAPETSYLAPLGDRTFVPGVWEEDMLTRVEDNLRIRFDDGYSVAELIQDDEVLFRFQRTDPFVLSDDELRTFTGVYGGGQIPVDLEVSISEGALLLTIPGEERVRLLPIAFDRFNVVDGGLPPGAQIAFDIEDGRATALILLVPGQPSIRIDRK
jgi:manganese oxidase